MLTGFFDWGTRTGGYLGLTGKYAVGVAGITPWWQLAGVVATVLLSGIVALVLCLIFERFGGLRVAEDAELGGLDHHHWGVSNFDDDLEPPLAALSPAGTADPVQVPSASSGDPQGDGLPV